MQPSSALYKQRIEQFTTQVTIYPVSCEKLAYGRSDEEWLDSVLAGGARIVQLRDKISDDRVVLQKAHIFRRKTREYGALFIINNRVDIALLADADGIHLGSSDLPAHEVRRLAPDMIIGVSANTREQAAMAEESGANYYNIGPLFPTETKTGLSEFIGPEAIVTYSAESNLPYTVMGGIKLNHVPQLTLAGAKRIAVVTALTKAENITEETKTWINAITEGTKN